MASQKPSEQDAIGIFKQKDATATRHTKYGGASGNSGKSGTASPPFATPDGRPAGQGATAPVAYVSTSRPQGAATGAAPPAARDVTAQSRAQTMGIAEQRVDPKSIPSDGITAPRLAPPYRAGTGSVGNARRPFKVK